MITIKLKYQSDQIFQDFLYKLRKQYSNVYRFAYNRFKDGLNKKEIYHLISSLNNIEMIKGRLINDCIDFSQRVFEKDKKLNKNSVFGGLNNFILRCKNKITKEEFIQKRLISLYLQGENNRNGNRFFNLDFINKKIVYKFDRKNYFELDLKISNNQLKQLLELEELCEQKQSKYTITLNETHICISFESVKHEMTNLLQTRFIGIDLNPESIGVSVCNENMDIIDTKCYDFSQIISKITKSKRSSDSKELKYLNNKLNFETIQIAKNISELSKHYQCKFIFIEDLKFNDNIKGKYSNRKNKNLWKRNLFIENLEKRCYINGQKIFKINPVYTSLIGNCMYNYVDPVNASIEVARRGYDIIIKKSKKFYPVVCVKESLIHQWKEMVTDIPSDWKELYGLTKNLKLNYRVSLKDVNHFSVFRKKSRLCDIYQFI